MHYYFLNGVVYNALLNYVHYLLLAGFAPYNILNLARLHIIQILLPSISSAHVFLHLVRTNIQHCSCLQLILKSLKHGKHMLNVKSTRPFFRVSLFRQKCAKLGTRNTFVVCVACRYNNFHAQFFHPAGLITVNCKVMLRPW